RFQRLRAASQTLSARLWSDVRKWRQQRAKGQDMRHAIIVLGFIGGFNAVSAVEASAGVFARGGQRGACVGLAGGVRGATVVRRGAVGYVAGRSVIVARQ